MERLLQQVEHNSFGVRFEARLAYADIQHHGNLYELQSCILYVISLFFYSYPFQSLTLSCL